jgi:hypothetical protein
MSGEHLHVRLNAVRDNQALQKPEKKQMMVENVSPTVILLV